MPLDKAFQPHVSTPVLNPDGTLNEQFVSYFNQIQNKTNTGDDEIEEALGAIYALLAPGLSGLGAQLFAQGKEVSDLVQSIAANQTQGNLTAATLGECKKTISDQEQLIAQLLSAVGGLAARLGELTKPNAIQFETAAYQLLESDSGVVGDASAGAFDVTLPDPTRTKDRDFFVQNAGVSGNVTAKPFAAESLSGAASTIILPTSPFTANLFKSDGIDWIVT